MILQLMKVIKHLLLILKIVLLNLILLNLIYLIIFPKKKKAETSDTIQELTRMMKEEEDDD